MKHLVLYHANCSDGYAAAFAAWLKLGYTDTAYIPVHYNAERDWIDWLTTTAHVGSDTAVYVLDFSFDRKTTEWLCQNALRFVWLDHHKSAFEMWCGRAMDRYEPTATAHSRENYILLDNNKSGAYLAWEYFHPETPVPLLIRHIDDRDRWQFKIDGTREFNAALRSMEPWSFEQWHRIFTAGGESFLVDEEVIALYPEGEAILRAHDQHVQSIARGAKDCWIKGPSIDLPGSFLDGLVPGWGGGLIVNCPPAFTSDVGHKLAKDCGTFGLMWHTVDGVEARCSLRSDGDYDVSAIAKVFGGGGHKNAAGFSVPLADLLAWYQN